MTDLRSSLDWSVWLVAIKANIFAINQFQIKHSFHLRGKKKKKVFGLKETNFFFLLNYRLTFDIIWYFSYWLVVPILVYVPLNQVQTSVRFLSAGLKVLLVDSIVGCVCQLSAIISIQTYFMTHIHRGSSNCHKFIYLFIYLFYLISRNFNYLF